MALGLLLTETAARLRSAGIVASEREARWLLEEVAGLAASELPSHLEQPATQRQVARLDALVARRSSGEPLQYVLGHWPFRSLDLLVDRRVLIPRPETEQLVDLVLVEVDRRRDAGPVSVVDLGTGSGAIALAVASERVAARVVASDRSSGALAVARANLAGLGRPAARVLLVEGDWFDALDPADRGSIHIVVSNPPYVAETDEVDPAVRDWEPGSALYGGPGGTTDLERIVGAAADWLCVDGVLLVELDPRRAAWCRERAIAAGFAEVEVHQDLTGRDRFVVARRAPV